MPSRRIYKDQQLCQQVAQALTFCINEGEPQDVMECVRIEAVLPAPDASRLMVTVSFDSGDATVSYDSVVSALESNASRLRFEVSQAINRRKTPQLAFCLIPFESSAR
jgi:ribosome-binding factor A